MDSSRPPSVSMLRVRLYGSDEQSGRSYSAVLPCITESWMISLNILTSFVKVFYLRLMHLAYLSFFLFWAYHFLLVTRIDSSNSRTCAGLGKSKVLNGARPVNFIRPRWFASAQAADVAAVRWKVQNFNDYSFLQQC
ncbi:uncharacterized protein A4U43_C01F5080 [Asparagus officinalis]|uniref:Uncharacterized protein n=1 Tax=Asparagus officinalis TaxID=4686 RepID=A0A5P1FRG9_ASPOF|nr:uncharacterized protein A4U43_C01F5080 [Asparagus officinalis]